jgi:hypothetical protein
MIQSTIELYADCARDTAQGMARSVWGLAGLVTAVGVLYVAQELLAGMGAGAGFLLGLVQAFCVGWYLSLIEITVAGRRSVRPSDLQESLGQYVWDVISVLFVFFVAQLVLSFVAPGSVIVALSLLATIAFNPAPEMIYQDRANGTALLGDAARFMQGNWPEWLVAHVGAALVLAAWGMLLTGGFSLATALPLVEMFGPFFGFVSSKAFAIAVSGGPVGIVAGLLLLVCVHAFMIFRGHLYRRLRGSSRRGRAWQSRTR